MRKLIGHVDMLRCSWCFYNWAILNRSFREPCTLWGLQGIEVDTEQAREDFRSLCIPVTIL